MGLKSIFRQNKAVLKFLAVFFGSYIILALLYQAYLKFIPFENYYPDYFTYQVAKQSYLIIDALGYETYFMKHPELPNMLIAIKDRYLVRIIEGCNSLSVIILFLSFILAFNKGFKKTFLYILFGSVLIYVLNLWRIALLTLGLYFYPQHKDFMHDILFPLFIYGVVFLLWLLWVRNYKQKEKV